MAVAITQTANPASAGTGTTVTYSGVSVGTAAHDRVVVVAVGTELTAGAISSCTIDGTAMNASTNGVQGAVGARIFWLHFPVGTTADIAVTFAASQSATTQHIAVYSVTGGQSTASFSGSHNSTDMDVTAPLSTGSTTITAGGGMIAVAACATGTVAKAWAQITEDIDEAAGGLRFTTAFSTTAGTATRTCTGTTNNEDGALAWVHFVQNASVERLPPQGDLALSSAAPTVGQSANTEITPPQGDVALSTVAPTVSASANVTITPASGNVVLSASAPEVTLPETTDIQPKAAQALLNNWIVDENGDPVLDETDEPILDAAANAPTVVQTANTQALPAAADLVISSAAPSALVAFTISPAAADLVLSSAAPTLSAAIGITPDAADLALSSAVPAVAASDHLTASPDAADIVLSTAAPTVAAGETVSIVPAFAELVLTSTAPTVAATANQSVTPDSSDLSLSASAPAVSIAAHQDIIPGAGDVVLTSTSPTVAAGGLVSVVPASASLVLSSTAPDVAATGQDTVVSPASANLTLSSAAPSVAVAFPALEVVGGGGGQPFRRRLPRKLPPRRVIQRPPPPAPVPVLLVPPFANLVLSSTPPTASVSNHLSVAPAAAGLIRLATAPVLVQTVGEHLTAEELLIIAEAA